MIVVAVLCFIGGRQFDYDSSEIIKFSILLRERHSSTNWTTDYLDECFGDRVKVRAVFHKQSTLEISFMGDQFNYMRLVYNTTLVRFFVRQGSFYVYYST